MNALLPLVVPIGAGILLGLFFFGGLWWTVAKGLSSNQPAVWFFGSMMLRTGIALAGFYFVGGTDLQRWFSCLIGFALARVLVQWISAKSSEQSKGTAKDTSHAPEL